MIEVSEKQVNLKEKLISLKYHLAILQNRNVNMEKNADPYTLPFHKVG